MSGGGAGDSAPGLLPITRFHGALLAVLHDEAFSPKGDRAWSAEEFLGLLGMEGVFGYLAVTAGMEPEALGFILARVAAGEGEVLTVAIQPKHRCRGVGGTLLDRVMAECIRRGGETLFLEVAEDNAPARALYEGRRFIREGRRKGYYKRGGERIDALVLSWTFRA